MSAKKRRFSHYSHEGGGEDSVLPCDALHDLRMRDYFDISAGPGKEHMTLYIENFETAEKNLFDLMDSNESGVRIVYLTEQNIANAGRSINDSVEKLRSQLAVAEAAQRLYTRMDGSIKKILKSRQDDLDPSEYTEAIIVRLMKNIKLWSPDAPETVRQKTKLHSIEDIGKVQSKRVLYRLLALMHEGGYHTRPEFVPYMTSLVEAGVFWSGSFPTNKILHHCRFNLETTQWLVAMYLMVDGCQEEIPQGCKFATQQKQGHNPWSVSPPTNQTNIFSPLRSTTVGASPVPVSSNVPMFSPGTGFKTPNGKPPLVPNAFARHSTPGGSLQTHGGLFGAPSAPSVTSGANGSASPAPAQTSGVNMPSSSTSTLFPNTPSSAATTFASLSNASLGGTATLSAPATTPSGGTGVFAATTTGASNSNMFALAPIPISTSGGDGKSPKAEPMET